MNINVGAGFARPCKTKTNKRILRYMKKTYVSPLMVEVNVAAENMLAASLGIHSDKEVDTSNGGQLGGNRRGEWGNLWQESTN